MSALYIGLWLEAEAKARILLVAYAHIYVFH